jgi:hypothetical protein
MMLGMGSNAAQSPVREWVVLREAREQIYG